MSDKTEKSKDPFAELRKHLRTGTLHEDERKMLEELFNQISSGDHLGTVGGRPIVARLPGGLDIIK